MTEIEKAVEQFFDKWMPVYAVLVCLSCFLFIVALAAGVVIGVVQRLLA